MTIRQRWKQTSLANKLLVIVGASAAFISFLSFGSASAQIYLAIQSNKQASDRTDRILSNLHWLAGSMGQSAEAAHDAIQQAQNEFIQSERPYIGTTHRTSDDSNHPSEEPQFYDTSGQVMWTWYYTNYGRSPAVDLRISETLDVVGIQHQTSKFSGGYTLPPTKIDYTTAVSPPKISAAEFRRLMEQTDDTITLRAKITYRDSFGRRYETGICRKHLRTSAIHVCETGDYIK